MLCAAASLAEQGWEPAGGKLLVALTACEETSRPVNGLQTLLPHLPTLHGAIVGEPTNLAPCVSQKGLLILEATARGKSAHAARPDQGINAIRQAALDIVALEAMVFDRIHPHLGPITKVVTMIDGGSARNVVPETCSFVVDFRTTSSYTHSEIIEAVRAAVASDVDVSSERYVPKQTPRDSSIAKAVAAALPHAEPFGSPTVSDWAFLEETPAVKLGPGESNLSHTGQECIALDEVVAAVGVYSSIAKHFFDIQAFNDKHPTYALEERS